MMRYLYFYTRIVVLIGLLFTAIYQLRNHFWRVTYLVWIHPKCNCVKGHLKNNSYLNYTSTCPSSLFRGPGQKVISYSFYGSTNSAYFKGLHANSRKIADLYPDWTIRLYHDINPNDSIRMADLCKAVCTYPNLDDCYVGELRNEFKYIEDKFGMIWRFLVLGDKSVAQFNVRDLDSQVHQREVDAVNEWLDSDKAFHIMRDHPQHNVPILGGMWGAKNFKNLNLMKTIRDDLLEAAEIHGKDYDQMLLYFYVWPEAQKDVMTHDSFTCQSFSDTHPWPTPRTNGCFVGDIGSLRITTACPKQCRPQNHQDWIYC